MMNHSFNNESSSLVFPLLLFSIDDFSIYCLNADASSQYSPGSSCSSHGFRLVANHWSFVSFHSLYSYVAWKYQTIKLGPFTDYVPFLPLFNPSLQSFPPSPLSRHGTDSTRPADIHQHCPPPCPHVGPTRTCWVSTNSQCSWNDK